jgi:hypothetical protein
MFLLHFGMHWAQVNGFALRLLFVRCGGERWQKLLPAVVTAKAERRSITLGTWHGRFVHRHTADRVDGHVKTDHFTGGSRTHDYFLDRLLITTTSKSTTRTMISVHIHIHPPPQFPPHPSV